MCVREREREGGERERVCVCGGKGGGKGGDTSKQERFPRPNKSDQAKAILKEKYSYNFPIRSFIAFITTITKNVNLSETLIIIIVIIK